MDYLEYKGYNGAVEYSKADNCFLGKVLGMSKDLILYEGNTIDELRADFEVGIDNYIAGCVADGIEPRKPYSGTLNIRISPEIHSKIAMLAHDLRSKGPVTFTGSVDGNLSHGSLNLLAHVPVTAIAELTLSGIQVAVHLAFQGAVKKVL